MRVLAGVALLVVVALVFTNPGPERFERVVDDEVTLVLRQHAADLPGGEAVARLGGGMVAALVRRHVERDNYLLFSVYSIDMAAIGLPGEEWRFVGIATTFFESRRPEALRH